VWSDGWPSLGDVADDGSDDGSIESTPDDELGLDELPGDLRDLVGSTDVVLGWSRTDGTPLALPAWWDDGSAVVARAFFEAAGAATASPASVTFDEWTGLGPSGKQGVMLRGAGLATSEADTFRVDLDIDRATHWDGIASGTVDLEG
jgi:hypothetical protein